MNNFIQKRPSSIIYFIQNSKNVVIALISSNKYFSIYYYDQFGSPPHRFVWTFLSSVIFINSLNASVPSYGNQSSDLLCKSLDWFLYEGNTGI